MSSDKLAGDRNEDIISMFRTQIEDNLPSINDRPPTAIEQKDKKEIKKSIKKVILLNLF